MARRAAYPGSFDPLTIAHLGIAETAWSTHGLDQVDLVISEVAIGKEDRASVRLDERVRAIQLAGRTRPWLPLVVPRPPHVTPEEHRLDVPEHLGEVSATAVREGRSDWMAPEAREIGAWD